MSLEFIKTERDTLAPGDDSAKKRLARLAAGEIVLVDLRRPRNLAHHRKFMALARFAFGQWNPLEQSIGGMPARKSFDAFRKELVINAGYYEVVLGMDGTPRLEAQSLSFDAMDQETFAEVYESVVAVLTAGILQGMSKEEAQRLADAVYQEGF